jgi:AGZA family xanthine/uracil permease-like MFS transporter
LGISIGSLFGLSPVTAFIESGAGISEGGKTGLTAITTGLCFFISIFFAPIFASIPPWATGCTLIIVGAMMAKAAKDINWLYFGDALPAFITLAVMPFTYSIAYGLIAGIVSYMIITTTTWFVEMVSGGRIVVPDRELREPWTWKVKGGLLPAWIVRAGKGKKDFWHEDPVPTGVERGEDSGSTEEMGSVNLPTVESRSDAETKRGGDGDKGEKKLD